MEAVRTLVILAILCTSIEYGVGIQSPNTTNGYSEVTVKPSIREVEASTIPKKVAFFAGLSSDFGPTLQDTDLVLEKVITNIGDAYDVRYGRFTAPLKATYQFKVVISAQSGGKAAVNVLKNGETVMTVWAESKPNWATSTSDAILSLEAGDQIWLQLRKEASSVYGSMYTSFSGFLIFEN